MKRGLLFVALTLGSSREALGQPSFDAASVRLHTDGAEERGGEPWLQASPGRVTMRNARLTWCLGWAYDLKDWVISGPDWITSERYDIVATTAGPVPVAQLKRMVQTLLADRFRLTLHHETRDVAIAVLVVGKNGTKGLQAAADGGVPDGPRPVGGKAVQSLIYKNVSMAEFADRLGGPAPHGVGERVVDRTGLAGTYDITLRVDAEGFTGGREEFGEFLKAAIERQFGLRVERRKVAMEMLIVDGGNRVPAEN